MILFSDLYSSSNLVVATFQNSMFSCTSPYGKITQSDRLIAFDALRMVFKFRGARMFRGGNCDSD